MGYFIPKLSLQKDSSDTILPEAGRWKEASYLSLGYSSESDCYNIIEVWTHYGVAIQHISLYATGNPLESIIVQWLTI